MLTSFTVAAEMFINIVINFFNLLKQIVLGNGITMYTWIIGSILLLGIVALFVRRRGG